MVMLESFIVWKSSNKTNHNSFQKVSSEFLSQSFISVHNVYVTLLIVKLVFRRVWSVYLWWGLNIYL